MYNEAPEWVQRVPVMILDFCQQRNVELVPQGDIAIFICPKIPESSVQERIKAEMPSGIQIQYVATIKMQTTATLAILLSQSGGNLRVDKGEVKERHLDYQLLGNAEAIPEGFWEQVRDVVIGDGFFESFTFTVNGVTVLHYDAKIAALIAEHTRTTVISQDDILNLSISLGAAQTVDEFLASI